MRFRFAVLLLLSGLFAVGCTQLTNLMTFNGLSEIPELTEPDIDDE